MKLIEMESIYLNEIIMLNCLSSVIGEREKARNLGSEDLDYVATVVKKDGSLMKSLATPGIIRTEQPNEIHIELHHFSGNYF